MLNSLLVLRILNVDCLVFGSNVVSYVVKPGGADSNQGMQQTVISKLKKVFVEASSQGNCKLQESVVLTIGQLGRVAEGELLLVVIVSLLESLTAHSQLLRAVAFKQVWSCYVRCCVHPNVCNNKPILMYFLRFHCVSTGTGH